MVIFISWFIRFHRWAGEGIEESWSTVLYIIFYWFTEFHGDKFKVLEVFSCVSDSLSRES